MTTVTQLDSNIIRVDSTHKLSSVYDSVKFQLILHRFTSKLSLNDNEIEVLTIFYVDGINDKSYDKIINSKIYKNTQSIENLLSNLKKQGIVDKVNKKKVITSKLPIHVDKNILMNIKIGNV